MSKNSKLYNDMRAARKRPEMSFGDRLDVAFKQIGAKRETYHGGSLNGVSVRRIMERRSDLFVEIDAAMHAIFDENHCKLSMIEIKQTTNKYAVLLGLFASIFSTLRQILPSQEQLQDLQKSQEAARKLWLHLNISRTHKLHLITDGHSLQQATRLQGIGSMLEDYVEHAHQLGMRDEKRTQQYCKFSSKAKKSKRPSSKGKQHRCCQSYI